MMEDKKKGLLVVSFGTSYPKVLEKTIAVIEKELQETHPNRSLYRAFTSGMIIKKLEKTENIIILNVEKALEKMKAKGIEDVLVQPTHVLNGIENDEMQNAVAKYKNAFSKLAIGAPLLTSPRDYKKMAEAVICYAKPKVDETLILMGHGTGHHANSAYPALEYTFRYMGYDNVLIGTIEGFPEFGDILKTLSKKSSKKLKLMPCLVVAGDHAQNDMAGEEEDSWKTLFTKAGYEVEILMTGLGELPAIREIFKEHSKEALKC